MRLTREQREWLNGPFRAKHPFLRAYLLRAAAVSGARYLLAAVLVFGLFPLVGLAIVFARAWDKATDWIEGDSWRDFKTSVRCLLETFRAETKGGDDAGA